MALETELQVFDSKKVELLSHHEGKFALIIGTELIDTFDQWEAAYQAGLEKKGNVPMLIKRVVRDENLETVPAMTLGLISAHL